MEKTTFKTTIKCSGCVDKVTPFLDEVAGKTHWSVDLNGPVKMLTVEGSVQPEKIVDALQRAGYKAERVD